MTVSLLGLLGCCLPLMFMAGAAVAYFVVARSQRPPTGQLTESDRDLPPPPPPH